MCPFRWCWSHFFPDNAQPIPPPAAGVQREQVQTGLPWDLIQVSTAPHKASATSLKFQISILAHAEKKSETPLEGAATGLASITTKDDQDNIIKYLIIFQVTDSEIRKSSAYFRGFSVKKILLIVHATCYIDLHCRNLNSPDDEWIKFHPKLSSFLA